VTTTAAKPEVRLPTAGAVETFLLEVVDVVNTTLDLETILQRVAELVRRIMAYDVFAILLLNEKTQELRIRFNIGHPPELAERLRIKLGSGITGRSAQQREPVLINDVSEADNFIQGRPGVRSELAVPMIVKNRVIGVIDLESNHPGAFTDEHARLMILVASRIAVGIENARLFSRASRQAQTLTVLNEISRELTSILNLDRLLERIGELLNRLIDYQMFSILLLDSTGQKLVHRFSLRFKESIQIKHDIPLDKGLVGYAAQHQEAVLVPDVSKDPRYIALNPETRSELCVPMMYKGKTIGVLDLEHTRRGYFTDDHRKTITTLAAQVAIAIENARLYERVRKEEERLERELAMAREVQVHLLPASCPTPANAQLAAKFVPAHAIGGDMYDFHSYSGARTGIAIGDVSGKGAPAALYAALVSGILRLTADLEPTAAEMLSALNLALVGRSLESQFVSLIYAVWDDSARAMQIANSGLPRPILVHEGKLEMINVTGLPLGLFPEAGYDEQEIQAVPGDLFVFMSDGILDATNNAGDLFGRKRLEEVVARNWQRTADDVVAAIFQAVADHQAGVDPFDDETVVAMKIKDGTPQSATRTKTSGKAKA
jgi:sigma-B regulation protein RsbU (phosphoserine phosphatase)